MASEEEKESVELIQKDVTHYLKEENSELKRKNALKTFGLCVFAYALALCAKSYYDLKREVKNLFGNPTTIMLAPPVKDPRTPEEQKKCLRACKDLEVDYQTFLRLEQNHRGTK